jgi:tRNA A-37 threonylcarbamoyl transferase component Bud32
MDLERIWICAESIGKRVNGRPDLVEKWRVSKGYRIKEIDEMIGLTRMR